MFEPGLPVACREYVLLHLSWYLSKNSKGSGVSAGVGANLRPSVRSSISSEVSCLEERFSTGGNCLSSACSLALVVVVQFSC